MTGKATLPNERAAEHRADISGWVCKTCGCFYGDGEGAERAARYCCEKDHVCGTDGCRNRVSKPYVFCRDCEAARNLARWTALEEVEWDGETPLVIHDDDKYFFDQDDLRFYLDENNIKIETVRLVIAEEEPKPHFDMSEFVSDYVPEDSLDVELGDKDINKTVNDWIKENVPQTWIPGKTRPTLASLRKHLQTNCA